ncbi:protein regulator of cytokinesis 1-like isoform X1 [Haliotis rufescens]|uniref:protein regulator of cytokinesis 1-like isoform X1 n=1 Tax=Haliotis rufescens TaxID=6454 RepID=UPI00201F7FCE|nr:protein regulator of cytokinesis 1-like isoform X1 [Haliotis rufescens]
MTGSSKDKIKTEVTGRLDAALNKLYHIWNEIGICESQMQERAGTVSHHLCNLLEEMVEEESILRSQIQQNIGTYSDEIKKLSGELVVTPFVPKESLTMLQKEKELRAKLDGLQQEKSSRMKSLKTLRDQDQDLCEVLCATPYYVASGTVPTKDQLKDLEKHIATLSAEKETRHTEFVQTKKLIIDLFNEMDRSPDTSFERDIMCEDDDAFQLSTQNMRTLKSLHEELEQKKDDMKQTTMNLWLQIHALWDRLEMEESEREIFKKDKDSFKPHVINGLKEEVARCEKLKFQNVQRFVEGIRRELLHWWEKCFYSRKQMDEFEPLTDEHYTEELLEVHERELAKVKGFYEKYHCLLDQIARREELFSKMIEFERKANDPNRYKNRRHNCLLQEEKERKKLMKELPKVEDDVRDAVRSWEKENNRPFLVEGVKYDMYIIRQREAYNEQKIREKEQRQKAKAKQIQEEMIFGSKPATPSKRAFGGTTPQKTPNKVRKLNDTNKTPASVSRIQHTSVFASPYRRAPMSASKTPNNRSQKRRSLRLARKVLSERNTGPADSDSMFSQTTVSSKDGGCGSSNASLASTGSYQDFAVGLNPTSRPYCRSSSIFPPPPRSPAKLH